MINLDQVVKEPFLEGRSHVQPVAFDLSGHATRCPRKRGWLEALAFITRSGPEQEPHGLYYFFRSLLLGRIAALVMARPPQQTLPV